VGEIVHSTGETPRKGKPIAQHVVGELLSFKRYDLQGVSLGKTKPRQRENRKSSKSVLERRPAAKQLCRSLRRSGENRKKRSGGMPWYYRPQGGVKRSATRSSSYGAKQNRPGCCKMYPACSGKGTKRQRTAQRTDVKYLGRRERHEVE